MKHFFVKIPLITFALLMSTSLGAIWAQEKERISVVNGIVKDEFGTPIENVIVRTESGKNEDFTHIDGMFRIHISDGSKNIILSHQDYFTKILSIEETDFSEVILEKDFFKKDALVNMGYTSIVKNASTSATSLVTGEELEKVPGAFLSSKLSGYLLGLMTLENSGNLTSPTVNKYVRGISSLNTSQPSVILDGVLTDNNAYENIPASDIQSISILKDPSALSLYGLQGSNGALVISTKRGTSGKLKFNVNIDQSFQEMTRKPYRINAWDYATLRNQAAYNDDREITGGLFSQYAAEEIQKYRDQNDVLYPNNDYYHKFWNDWSMRQRIGVNAVGGTDVAKYYTSINLTHQEIPFNTDPLNEKYDPSPNYFRLDFRGNLDMNFTDNFSGFLLISGSVGRENYPGAVTSPSNLYSTLFNFAPSMFGPLVPNDTASYQLASNQVLTNNKGEIPTYGLLNRSGYAYYLTTNVNTQIGLKYGLDDFIKGLSLSGNLGYALYSYIGQIGTQTYELYQQPDRDSLAFIRYGSSVNSPLTIIPAPAYGSYLLNYTGKLNYQRKFNAHSVNAMAYFNYIEKIQPTWQTAAATMFPYLQQNNGVSISYGFDNKYYAKVDLGYTGSDQFAPANRYVSTPSVGAAWIASNENFMKGIEWLSFLKIRGSVGFTANDRFAGNRLSYMDNLSISGQELGIGNPNLVAEKTFMQNYGIDIEFHNAVSIVFDIFSNRIDNMIVTDNRLPVYTGTYNYSLANAPPNNIGAMENKGFDFGVDYYKQINKGFAVFSSLKLSYAKNIILVTNEIERPTPEYASAFLYTGNSAYQPIGYEVDYDYTNADGVANGYINDETTLAIIKEMYEKGGIGTPRLGDLIYKDKNNDGKIDTKDYTPIKGSWLPSTVYSLSGGLQYKSIELSVMAQGVGNRYVNVGYSTGINETYHEGVFSDAHLNAWSEERYANRESINFPALGIRSSTSHLPNDFFVQNTSFIRLKNVELAYTLPQIISKKISAQKIRIAVNAHNIFTWTTMKLTTHFDPEVPDLASIQPFKIINIGARVTF